MLLPRRFWPSLVPKVKQQRAPSSKEYALILAFDVKVNQEAQKQADTDGVTIFTADIIYHLQDKFTKYMEKYRESQKTETRRLGPLVGKGTRSVGHSVLPSA